MQAINLHLSVDRGGPAVTLDRVIPEDFAAATLDEAWAALDPDRDRVENPPTEAEDGDAILLWLWRLGKANVNRRMKRNARYGATQIP